MPVKNHQPPANDHPLDDGAPASLRALPGEIRDGFRQPSDAQQNASANFCEHFVVGSADFEHEDGSERIPLSLRPIAVCVSFPRNDAFYALFPVDFDAI